MSEEREVLELDVVIVGGGPAGLSAALHLKNLIKRHNEEVAAGKKEGSKLDEPMIAILEKGAAIGNHIMSGAVMDPIAIKELMPDYEEQGCPGIPCDADQMYKLSATGKMKMPYVPKFAHNEGNRIMSLSTFTRWLGEKVEAAEVEIFPEFPAADLIIEDGKVMGVRTGDKGVDKDGQRKSNFEQGYDVRAKVTILAEGTRGSLTKQLVNQFKLDEGKNPQVYAAGIKELWRVPGCDATQKGRVIHTMGYPLDNKTFGGGFIYFMGDDLVQIGHVTGLDYRDPTLDPHAKLQEMKMHPFVRELLAGGEMVRYGAKSLPEGGWYSRPKPYVDGALIVGDAGSNLNPARLKGVHTAIKTGMLAAETALDALIADDASAAVMKKFEDRVEASWLKKELYAYRNFHQAFVNGSPTAFVHIGLQMITGGRGFKEKYEAEAGHTRMKKLSEVKTKPSQIKPDGKYIFDKLTDVFNSGTTHEEDQPCHLVVTVDPNHCSTTCADEYGNPCQHFCPANVYEMEAAPSRDDDRQQLKINASNCVHCKTCDIMDPYQAINWIPPEGGGGPVYTDL